MVAWREWLDAMRGTLRCTRAEALALAVLAAGAVVVTAGLLWLAVPAADPAGDLAEGADPVDPAAPADPTDPADPGKPAAPADPTTGEPVAPTPAAPAEPDPVAVHVTGQVAQPGVVTLSDADRVTDAVEAAGGPTAGADLEAVNLARPLRDGERLHVPHVDDDAATRAAAQAPDGQAEDAPVPLNTADAAALEALPGVGEVTAERILSHREAHGDFAAVEELLEVPGIGEATLEQLRDHLTL